MEETQKYDINKLNQLYNEAETADSDVFAEMRTNILLCSGYHYRKIARGLDRNLRMAGVEKSKRLRLVKNHTAKAVSDIQDILASLAPGVMPYPASEHERSHQKAAELARAVWEDAKRKNDIEEFDDLALNSFVTTGEVAAKIYFDPIKGGLKAYQQKLNERGEPLWIDPRTGIETTFPEELALQGLTPDSVGFKPAPDKSKPVFRGIVRIEKIEPYNLLRPKNAKSMRSAKFLIYRHMEELEDVKALIRQSNLTKEEKEERLEWVKESGETTYKIFDGTTGSFQDAEGQILIREFYFRQSPEFPRGYFFITCERGILFEGEIPFGEAGEVAFPIKWAPYEIFEGSARGFSPIKRFKPAQLEINRCASAISETQITVGWDKLILSKNAKVSRGADQPGLRIIHTTETSSPIVIPGRSGEQFSAYLEYNVNELYRLAQIPENANPVSQSTDPRVELFKKQSQRARFTRPGARFARFKREVCETCLFLSQKYLSEDEVIQAVGKSQTINVPEFKQVNRLDYVVKVKEVSDDLETMLGKSLELETIIQYMGKNLDPETGKILLTQFPILNKTRALKHLTLELENIESDILALDRGEWREANPDDEHALYIKHLTHRMKQRDFEFLPPEVQENYYKRRKQHQDFIAQIAREQAEAAAGFIPTGGALAKADLYINPDPNNPYKTQRAVFPTESLEWLKKRLEAQGTTQELLRTIESQSQAAQIGAMAAQMMPVLPNPDALSQPQAQMMPQENPASSALIPNVV